MVNSLGRSSVAPQHPKQWPWTSCCWHGMVLLARPLGPKHITADLREYANCEATAELLNQRVATVACEPGLQCL